MTLAGRCAKRVWKLTQSARLTIWTYQFIGALQYAYLGFHIKRFERRMRNV